MTILIVGSGSSITTTIQTMLESINDWLIQFSDLKNLHEIKKLQGKYDLIVANIEDFDESSTKVVSQIYEQFPNTPLLVIHSYLNKTLIMPMIKAGATGYLQNNVSENQLIETIQKVASGKQCIIAETT